MNDEAAVKDDVSQAAAEPSVDTEDLLEEMWNSSMQEIAAIDPETENWKIQALPLARIKKIMKNEEFILQQLEVDRLREQGQEPDQNTAVRFMISAEAPLFVSKACELMIRALAVRAWQHTKRHRRRTLQRQDIHAAVGESDVFDFLIDIVPRVATNSTGPQQQVPPTDTQPAFPNLPAVPAALAAPAVPPAPVAPPPPAAGGVNGSSLANQGTTTDFSQVHDQMKNNQLNIFLQQMTNPTVEGVDAGQGMAQPQQPSAGLLQPQPQQEQPDAPGAELLQQPQQQPGEQQQEPPTQNWTDPTV